MSEHKSNMQPNDTASIECMFSRADVRDFLVEVVLQTNFPGNMAFFVAEVLSSLHNASIQSK